MADSFLGLLNALWLTKRQKKRPAAKAGGRESLRNSVGERECGFERGNEGEDVTASVPII